MLTCTSSRQFMDGRREGGDGGMGEETYPVSLRKRPVRRAIEMIQWLREVVLWKRRPFPYFSFRPLIQVIRAESDLPSMYVHSRVHIVVCRERSRRGRRGSGTNARPSLCTFPKIHTLRIMKSLSSRRVQRNGLRGDDEADREWEQHACWTRGRIRER